MIKIKSIIVVVLLALFFVVPVVLAVGESCDTRASECCAPPPIVVDGGGCPANEYWIGDAAIGYCRPSTTVCGSPGDAQNFSCMSGGCTGQAQSTSTTSTPLCGGDSGKIHLGGADVNNCASKVTVIQDPTTTSLLKAWLGDILGTLVYLRVGTTCNDKETPFWDTTQDPDRWMCYLGSGVWDKTGNDIKAHYSGNVGIGTSATPTAKLEVNGEIKGFGTAPVGAILDWFCPAAAVNATNCNALLPSNWKVCDGSVVSDAASPFNTKALPNLVGKFARGGKADYTNMGGTGGAPAPTVAVPNPTITATIPAHTHTVNTHSHTVPTHHHTLSSHTHSVVSHTHPADHNHEQPIHHHSASHSHSIVGGNHQHLWVYVDNGDWISGDGQGIIWWGDGADEDGTCWYSLFIDSGAYSEFWTSTNSMSASSVSMNTGDADESCSAFRTYCIFGDGCFTRPAVVCSADIETGSKAATNTDAATGNTSDVSANTDSQIPLINSTSLTLTIVKEPAYINLYKIIRIK